MQDMVGMTGFEPLPEGRYRVAPNVVSRTGRGVPTVDLRVDYHRAAMPGVLTVRGKIVHFGKQFSVAEASVFDKEGRLPASGRGTYLTTPPA